VHLLGGAEDEGEVDPDLDFDDGSADELCDLDCDGRCDAECDELPGVGEVFDPLDPDAAGDELSEVSVRAVRIASTSITTTEAANASRRRQYTDGG